MMVDSTIIYLVMVDPHTLHDEDVTRIGDECRVRVPPTISFGHAKYSRGGDDVYDQS